MCSSTKCSMLSPFRWTKRFLSCAVVIWSMIAGQRALAQEPTQHPSNGDEHTDVLVHVVQPGDTLDSIAELYAVSPQAILESNGLSSAVDLYIGQRLVIPQPYPDASSLQIIVGLGDTLEYLALRYQVPPEVLGRINRVVNPSLLYAGQPLIIPPARNGRTEQVGLFRVSDAQTIWHISLLTNANPVTVALQNSLRAPVLVPPEKVLLVTGQADDSASMLTASWSLLSLHPLPLQAGRSAGLTVRTQTPTTVTGDFLGSDLQFVFENTTSYSILSVNRWTAPGLYPITINIGGQVYTRQVLVTDGGYTQEVIRLSEEDYAILGDSQSVQEESDYIRQKMSGFTSVRYWIGLFQLPTSGVMSSAFGTVRSYNGGGYNSFHGGTDFVAPAGTPVYAPASGVVVDSGFLTVRGYYTVIDHGWGVYSGFWHQSTVLVSPGDSVVAGQQIGTVGNTGLSTAAHLHWEMWVDGNQVDPLQWAREVFP